MDGWMDGEGGLGYRELLMGMREGFFGTRRELGEGEGIVGRGMIQEL
jgi:hypothetical protein